MERPRVVISVGSSVDGKIALTRQQTLMQQPSGALWAALSAPDADRLRVDVVEAARQVYGCTAVLEGSGSLVPDDAELQPLPHHGRDPDDLYGSYLSPELDRGDSSRMWFTVVDGRGRVRWTERPAGWDILVLVSRATPADYLAYLRREQISYLVAGQDRVDLSAAMSAMASRLEIGCIVSTAGGGLNAALLRAGLVDEVALALFPALIGGSNTPSVLDGAPLAVGDRPVALRLLSVHTDLSGTVRLRYEVNRAVPGHTPASAEENSAKHRV